ncbi:MAG TPA: patatin-like phospholipase family protein [Nitrososphaeraceae archaeon]|jgi:predicted acylesterase/phospholipase RssA
MEKDYSTGSNGKYMPCRQRALVLQGGGALGAYEAGVIEILCERLADKDKECGREGGLLFDVVAGTSIGAMNAAIFVSQYLETQNWEKAAKMLQKFWKDQLAVKEIDISELSEPWYNNWIIGSPYAASVEAARRYYSVKKLVQNQVRNNVYSPVQTKIDNVFYDNAYQNKGPNDDNPDCKDPNCKKPNFVNNDWFLHNTNPLRESIRKYAKFPIATSFKGKDGQDQGQHRHQPRLLIFSVDVAEGITVRFDSYDKADGSRRSEYGKYTKEKGYDHVIEYDDGISIDQVMASGTVPEFYEYATVPTHTTDKYTNVFPTTSSERNLENDNKDMRYFLDGGWLSNTPFRELLTAHQDYWKNKPNGGKIPDLDVYIVNVHPSKYGDDKLRQDHDGVKERKDDIIYSDRTSHYDEKMAHLITDYANFCSQLEELVNKAIGQVKDEEKRLELEGNRNTILTTKVNDEDSNIHTKKYEDLVKSAFDLSVVRIERHSYINNVSTKTGDLTFESISKLIIEGKCDAWFTIIEKCTNDLKLDDEQKQTLIDSLNLAWQDLRKKDYEDDNSKTYSLLRDFIKKVEDQKKLESEQYEQYDSIVKFAQSLLAVLNYNI